MPKDPVNPDSIRKTLDELLNLLDNLSVNGKSSIHISTVRGKPESVSFTINNNNIKS